MSEPLATWLADLRIHHTFLVVGRFAGTAGVLIEAEGASAFHYCVSGPCFVELEGQPPLRLDGGDFLFMRRGLTRAVWSGEGRRRARPAALASLIPSVLCDAAVCFSIGEGRRATGDATPEPPDERVVLGGAFCVESPEARLFIDALPPLFVVRQGAPHTPRLRTIVGELVDEATAGAPGASPVVARLAEVAVLIGVRSFASTGGNGCPLLDAARDPRLGRALQAIHREPGSRWTLAGLGRVAGMSRSGFAAEFTAGVGETPALYLARVRMARAERLMIEQDWPLPRIAEAVGYSSAAAFSVAFKRLRGTPPSAVRRQDDPRASSSRAVGAPAPPEPA